MKKKNQEFNKAFEQLAKMIQKSMDNLDKKSGKPNLFDEFAELFYPTYEFEPISTEEWSLTHPMGVKCGSDKFYADFANDVQERLLNMRVAPNMPDGVFRETAMAIAAYLEDFVSDLGVWRAMRGLYRERFGTWLPFFDCSHDDYAEDDVNIEDIQYLVWQAMMRCGQQENRMFSPLSQYVTEASKVAYDTMLECIDCAPPATRVSTLMRQILQKDDYYAVRSLALWLSVDNKLTSVSNARIALAKRTERTCGEVDHISEEQVYYLYEAMESWKKALGMTGCPASELLASIVRSSGFANVADKLDVLKQTDRQAFKIVSHDQKNVTFEDVQGREYIVDRDSIGQELELDGMKTCVTQLVKYGDNWMQNGVGTFTKDEPWSSGEVIIHGVPDNVVQALRAKVKKARGRRVFYYKSMEEMMDSLNVSIPFRAFTDDEIEEIEEGLVVLVSDTDDPLFVSNNADIFKDKDNPYYGTTDDDEEYLTACSLGFISDYCVADDVAAYIQKKRLLPYARIHAAQGRRVGKALVQDNLRFLFGFYRVPSAL